MNKNWLKLWFVTLMTILVSIEAREQDLLKSSDIDRIMSQILSQHVDKRTMTSKILNSSIAIFINQFDPERIYLLESEIAPYAHLSQKQLDELVEQYKQNDFEFFEQINKVFQNAIERSKKLRHEIEIKDKEALFQTTRPSIQKIEERLFAKDEKELKKRLLKNLENFISLYKSRHGELSTSSKKEFVLKTYENHLTEFENQYLYQDDQGKPLSYAQQDNLLTIHILKALANSLDSHTTFYQTHEAYDMKVRLQKEFQGIGLILRDQGDKIIVSRMLEGGPAAKSEVIQAGDILLGVDGISTEKLSFDKVMEMLHESKQAQVELSFKRKEKDKIEDKIFKVELQKEEIVLNNNRVDVSEETFGNGIIGKITLHSFYQGNGISSEKDVRDAIVELEKKGNLRGLILDLRENSGGFLSQAVKVAGLFITNGVIVISKYSTGEERFYRDVDGKIAYDGPLVVLISKATASAAEIVAQALQDYGVAIVVGDEHTYGKGTIQTQTVTDDQSTSYFKVTVGKYYTVSGKTPQKNGVKADVIAPGPWSLKNIGEVDSSSLTSDFISDAYEDNLSDIAPDVKSWYLKYYVPTIQKRTDQWKDLIPTLRKNSEYRLAHNKNYQLFLKGKALDLENEEQDEESEWLSTGKKAKNFGVDDLQMQEAVNVIKDMIVLYSIEKKK
ncbi:tail-specific protease Tsp [Candidatus Protochlamydia sp. W-9]|uniref:tail-specific protease Tsp n=1 Tax=Candidatus Protochlamydia sp. W-9 TaxID=1785087 RepID=UPI0009AEA0D0|nr:S41 family peptidase [Candidatus Protochlamydia sp. W-9]